jgi:AmmeMemoRadiSam system protein B/AmmeMemoRadiSam system protein A
MVPKKSISVIAFLIVAGVTLIALNVSSKIPEKGRKTMESSQKNPPELILKSPLAGSWYPGDRETLNRQLEGFVKKAVHIKPLKDVIGLILPHAGYMYSGQAAVLGLKTVDKKYERIVVIGPSHSVSMSDQFSVPPVTHYQTPLGKIPLDLDFIDRLLKNPMFQKISGVHDSEHSVQIEVPLLQFVMPGEFKLVPIVAGQCSEQAVQKAADFLQGLVDDKTLVVASSDFTHYGPNFGYVPFKKNVPEEIKKLDLGAYAYIEKLDMKGFREYQRKTGATICGRVPIAVMLALVPSSGKAHLVEQTTSGEMTGDYSSSVSYLSIAFTGSWKSASSKSDTKEEGSSEQEKKNLLKMARQAIQYYLKNKRTPKPEDLGIPVTESMKQKRAAFVTLRKDSRLRGCIGDILPRVPLYESVINNAINAAVNDHRFSPVTLDECDKLSISISALTVPEKIDNHDKIRIGTDGVILRKEGRSAVFLPQVAPEQGWDVAETLTHLSTKAGLPADAWKKGAQFEVFQAIVFKEK